MLANVIAFFAAIAICTVIALAGGGQTNPIVIFVVMIVTFGIANAINRASRHSVKGNEQSPLIITSTVPDSLNPLRTHTAEPATGTSASSTTAISQTLATRAAGELHNGKLMITKEVVLDAIRNPDQYDNVVVFAKPPASPANMAPETWYLALSADSGAFFNESASQIWSVTPETVSIPEAASGVRIPRWGWPTISSIDGRKQTVPADIFHVAILKAWKSPSLEAYTRNAQPWPDGWGVLAYELMTGKMVSKFFKWPSKYATLLEGIDLLRSNPSVQKAVLNIPLRHGGYSLGGAGDVMIKNALRLNVPQDHPIIQEIQAAKKAVAKRTVIILAILFAVAVAIVVAINIRVFAR